MKPMWTASLMLTPETLSENERAILIALMAGSVSLMVAAVGVVASYFANKREQRRLTYSQAVRAATAWKELLYRVRRRQAGDEASIVEMFHQAQDDLIYYEAWVGAHSRFMARSYSRLVKAVKSDTDALIRQAWESDVRPAPANALDDDAHPRISWAVGAFLQDVRSHLSPWPWRKLAMAWRNRKGG